jgi:flagellar M-ring protein FliF
MPATDITDDRMSMELSSTASKLDFRGLGANLTRLGPVKLAGLGVAALLALGAIWFIARAPQAANGLLYAGLEPADAGRIAARLDELRIPVEARGDGTILVPSAMVPRLRMQFASEGLPRQTGAGYELLDQVNPMQMTSFMQRVQRLRALEGELARTIVAMHGVRTARVHIVLPERETFSRDAPQPTASVSVTTSVGGRLSSSQAAAIRLLVAGAVPRLRQEAVSVLDPSGVVLAADGAGGAMTGRVAEMRALQEAVLQKAVLDLLEPLVGRGKVRAIAAVEIDATRMVAREEKFDPIGQVERSRQTSNESENNEDSRQRDPVTVGQNLPNQQQQPGGNGQRSVSRSERNNDTVNYEISSRVEEVTREPGAVRRVSMAVVVDGVPDAAGAVQPRTREELDRFAALVRSAIGFDERRGDRVTVDGIRFLAEEPLGSRADAVTEDGGLTLWLGLGALLVALVAIVAWLLLRQRAAANRLDVTLAPSAAEELPLEVEALEPELPAQRAKLMHLASINEVIDERPEEAVVILRSWIQESLHT